MKNVIEYYYGLRLNDIHQSGDMYTFAINGMNFAFLPYTRSLEELEDLHKLSLELFKNKIKVHQFLPNINNSYLTYINNDNINNMAYVLFQVYNNEKRKITLQDIVLFSNKTYSVYDYPSLNRNNWAYLWSNKIDYFEYQINQFGKEKKNIKESFPYYSGIVENAISFLNTLKLKFEMLSLSHKRINDKDTVFEFYNPLNLIVDYRIRDICEYYKCNLNNYIKEDVLKYIQSNFLTTNEIYLLFIRMMYATFYFDSYEKCITVEDDDLDDLEIKTLEYENLLRMFYNDLSKHILMPNILWLK